MCEACAGALDTAESGSVTDNRECTVWTVGRELDTHTMIYDAIEN